MFGHRFTLFRICGFAIKADASWLFLALLVTWSLAQGVFPQQIEGLSTAAYWWMGALGAVGLFASIIVHELGHSLVARRFGLAIRDITLFIFGGVADMEEEPPSPKAEFWMALAGPSTSIAIALVLFGGTMLVPQALQDTPALRVLTYLAWLNALLAAFNILPAFPLDGGRLLRAMLWSWKNNLQRATRIASGIGTAFGTALIVLGVIGIVGGTFIAGLWWFMIGMFMRAASQSSYRHVLIRRALEGESLRRFMKEEPVTVPAHTSVADLVENYVYKFHYKMFPVTSDGRLRGCVTTKAIRDVPREEWEQHTVGEISESCSDGNSIHADADPMDALTRMNRTGNSRLLVVEGEKLVGIVALKDLLNFLSLKMDLEGQDKKK